VRDRRRNLAILGLVAALLLAAVVAIVTKPTKLGLDLKGGVELVYQAKPTKFTPQVTGEAITRSIEIMRKRVDQLGVSEPEIQRSGADQITVSLPSVKNADEAINQVGTVAQLFFYDWEKNVIGPNGKPDPTNQQVTGGQFAGNVGAGCLPQFDAIARARHVPPKTNSQASTGDKFYLVDDKARKVLAGPQETDKALTSSEAAVTARAKGVKGRVVKVPEGTVIVRAESSDKAKTKPDCWYVLNDNFALRGTDIKNPKQNFDSGTGGTGQPNVTFEFTSRGRNTWQGVTREIAQRGQDNFVPGQDPRAANQHFAIVLDNELISVPYIDFRQNPDGIDGANGSEISGGFTIKSAQQLTNLLATGALPIKLDLISQQQVSATLGQQALDQGVIAAAVGFAIVALFLLIFYRVLGMIAVSALVVYGVFLFALVKLVPITLTLPGLAGLVLTIGVTADANIVIFERVKEEIRAGRSVAAGIALGYKRGIAAIIDANVVTFLTAFILFILATAGVKGFALVLGIGTLVTIFTAVLLTQAVLGTMGRSRLISHPAALGAGGDRRGWHIDFMGLSKWFFSMSGVILLVGALAIGGKGLHFGIDFESGTRMTAAFVKSTDETGVRDVLAGQGLGDAKIQRIQGDKQLGPNAFQVSAPKLAPDRVTRLTAALDQAFGIRGSPSTQSIGPTFGNTVAKGAVIAIIVSLLVISAYIALRFEWKYAVPVLIALMHDLLITAGVYSLVGREVTTSTVAALLTILGFSLYDTIIVFDRVRENTPRMPRATFSQIVNRSMSEVLTRSLATSFCTALPVLALLLFGGETLKDFAFALLVGIISGAYSSVFIASPVLTHWKEREPMWRRRDAATRAANGGVVPAYATGDAAQPVDVDSKRRARRRVTAPQDPAQGVSKAEFDEMVRDLHPEPTSASAATDSSRDLSPEDLVLKDDKPKRPKQRGPRNRKHGR
jgi:SecD/SecF fusion protein